MNDMIYLLTAIGLSPGDSTIIIMLNQYQKISEVKTFVCISSDQVISTRVSL